MATWNRKQHLCSKMARRLEYLDSHELKRFLNRFKRYCIIQNDHLELEEAVLMPAMLNHLTAAQCQLIREQLATIEDPLLAVEGMFAGSRQVA